MKPTPPSRAASRPARNPLEKQATTRRSKPDSARAAKRGAAAAPANKPVVTPGTKPAPKPATKRAAKPAAAAAARGRRIQVRLSGVHGKGVYALQAIPAGDVVIEYLGEVITWPEALRRHPHDPKNPHHTFYFHVDDARVIDGKAGGNAARWINHACEPNCEADEVDGRIFIKALRDLFPGEELFYDYGLIIDERYTPTLKKQYECRCGTAACRRTMLAPKRSARA